MRMFRYSRLLSVIAAVVFSLSWGQSVYAMECKASYTASYSVPYAHFMPDAVTAPVKAAMPNSDAVKKLPYTMTSAVLTAGQTFGGVKHQTSPRVARADTGDRRMWRSSV